MDDYAKRAVDVFRECARIPLVSAASVVQLDGGRFEVLTKWSQRDLERGTKISFSRSFFLERRGTGGVQKLVGSTFQYDASNQIKISHVPQAGTRAVLVKGKSSDAKPSEEPQQFIEIWNKDCLQKTVVVGDIKKHGKIHEDQKEKPKTTSFFKKTTEKSGDGKAPVQGREYVSEDDWGEQLTSVVDPVVVVMSVDSEECEVVSLGEDISAAQALWVPEVRGGGEGGREGGGVEGGGGGVGREGGGEVVCVGWHNKPRKLGLVYCMNRMSALYQIQLGSGKITALTGHKVCVYSPRFSPRGDKLVYFQAPGSGSHRSCASLKMIKWSTKEIVTVVDVMPRPSTDGFAGFYSTWLPEKCWNEAGTCVFSSESCGSLLKIVQIDVDSGEVNVVSSEEEKGAWSVICVSHDLIIAQHASLSRTPRLMVGVISANATPKVSWNEITQSPVSMVTEGLSWKVLSFTPDDSTSIPYEAILLKPRPSSSPAPPPLVVYPHGGPHIVVRADFLIWPICLAALGMAVVLVNYRGSSGFGQEGIDSLPGKIGRQDVDDIQKAVKEMVKSGEVDGDKVSVLGGSHGGFLALHLIGQFPDFYKAASIRNPVVDMAGMRLGTDIPDWAYVECGLPFDPTAPPDPDIVAELFQRSPIIHVHKIKAGVLIRLGAYDRRVPPSQGKFLYHTLKSMGKPTRLHVYPECHPISAVHYDADCFVNTAIWLHQHTS